MKVLSEYIKTLIQSEFDTHADVEVNASNDTVIAEHRIPTKQRWFLGNGAILDGVDTRGTFSTTLKETTPGDVDNGVLQLRIADANKLRSDFIREDRITDVDAGIKVGKGGKVGNEKTLKFATEDEYIQVTCRLDSGESAVTYDASASSISLPVTIQAMG